MPGQFAILDEELENHVIRLIIAREAYRRGELPDEDIMDALWSYRSLEGPRDAYAYEREHGEANLEQIISIVRNNFHSRSSKATKIEMGDGMKDALLFDDPESPLSYELKRIKDLERFIAKALENIDIQNETGFDDHKAVKWIVEHPDAKKYRTQREFSQLSRAEQREFKREFKAKHNRKYSKAEFSKINDRQKKHFYDMFAVDYHDLTAREQDEYRSEWEDTHREMCRDIAKRITSMKSFPTTALQPHFLSLGDLALRMQRQIILDSDGKVIAELEYVLQDSNQSAISNPDFFNSVLESSYQEIIAKVRNRVSYLDHDDRKSVIFDLGNLLLNFHFYDVSAFGVTDATVLAKRIDESSKFAIAKFPRVDSEEQDKAILEKRDTRYLKAIRTGMPDIPLGLFIFTNTDSRDLHSKYNGLNYDEESVWKTMVRDRTFPNWLENEYEDVKLYICPYSGARGMSVELQIMDPIMVEKAEWGVASRGKFRETKRERYEKRTEPLSQKDKRLLEAYCGTGEQSENYLSQIMANFYARKILGVAREIKGMEVIQSLSGTDVENDFDTYMLHAQDRINSRDKRQIQRAANAVFDSYAKSKGMGVLQYQDSLWAINEMVHAASEVTSIELRYFKTDIELKRNLHERHINYLFGTFENLTGKDKDPTEVAASLCLEYLMRNYNEFYGSLVGGVIDPKLEQEYASKINGLQGKSYKRVMRRNPRHPEKIGVVGHMQKSYGRPINDLDSASIKSTLVSHGVDQNTAADVLGIYTTFFVKTKH